MPTAAHHYNVLFVCTGNSARSIMAEAILNFKGKPRFTAYSAGSHPSGEVRPEAIARLQAARIPTQGLRSKSWDEFSQPGAPKLDFIFTVCDNAAREVCPVIPHALKTAKGGAAAIQADPTTAHWGVPDPAAIKGAPQESERAFSEAFTNLERRIDLFLLLPLASIDRVELKREVDRIGQQ